MARADAAAKRKAEGGRQISASLTKDEVDLLERAKAALGAKTNKDALIQSLERVFSAPDPTPEQALEVLARMVRK